MSCHAELQTPDSSQQGSPHCNVRTIKSKTVTATRHQKPQIKNKRRLFFWKATEQPKKSDEGWEEWNLANGKVGIYSLRQKIWRSGTCKAAGRRPRAELHGEGRESIERGGVWDVMGTDWMPAFSTPYTVAF
jgi:hypothetical protein